MGEWELEFGASAPTRVDGLMREVVEGHMARTMSDTQRALAAWYRANGDRERTHTTGVFLKRPRTPGAAPVLGVYVDSHAMATDFGVNKDIYLARLANVGLAVSGIDFLVSRKPRESRAEKDAATSGFSGLPEATPVERAEAAQLVSDLPESLKARAYQAIVRSKQRARQQESQK